MRLVILLLCLSFFTGCAVFQSQEASLNEPQLLKQAPLPSIPLSIADQEIEIYCEMLISETGTVNKARLLKGSGDKTWDLLAEQSLLKWEYSPALLDGKPVQLLVRRKIKVLFAESKEIPLAEIAFDDIAVAETVYNALMQGKDFSEMASKYSVNATRDKGGVLGKVNVQYFTKEIRSVLLNLNEEEFTRPLSYGEHYIIFKRLKEPKAQELKLL